VSAITSEKIEGSRFIRMHESWTTPPVFSERLAWLQSEIRRIFHPRLAKKRSWSINNSLAVIAEVTPKTTLGGVTPLEDVSAIGLPLIIRRIHLDRLWSLGFDRH
jgi:hypothetical protein